MVDQVRVTSKFWLEVVVEQSQCGANGNNTNASGAEQVEMEEQLQLTITAGSPSHNQVVVEDLVVHLLLIPMETQVDQVVEVRWKLWSQEPVHQEQLTLVVVEVVEVRSLPSTAGGNGGSGIVIIRYKFQ